MVVEIYMEALEYLIRNDPVWPVRKKYLIENLIAVSNNYINILPKDAPLREEIIKNRKNKIKYFQKELKIIEQRLPK